MQKAKGVVFTNKQGQQFFDQIIRGLDTVPVKPLFLQQSGSLDRLIAGDPDLSWIVSTVACIFQHQRDEKLVTEMLTAFIIESHRSPVFGTRSSTSAVTQFSFPRSSFQSVQGVTILIPQTSP
jgi:hypothetical protein